MPVGLLHRLKDLVNEGTRHLFVEQVAHRVHEDHPRTRPLQWLVQSLGPEGEIEPSRKRMTWDPPKSLGEACSIAVVAAARDLRASGNRIPRCIRPLDRRPISHHIPQLIPTDDSMTGTNREL